jgi:hypothetical protein
MSRIAYSHENIERIYLVGFQIGSEPSETVTYTLMLYYEVARNDQNRPLTHDGRIVFFQRPNQANEALSLGDAAFRKYGKAPAEISAVYDVHEALQLVRTGTCDDNATIVNLLNELFDLVSATPVSLPNAYRDAQAALADHATFSRDLGEYFGDGPDRRALALDAMHWSIGVVLAHSTILS